MCGIALIHGPGPDRAAFRQMIGSLAPRGELEETLLTERLNTLVESGVMRRVPYHEPGQRKRHEYRLTEKGLELLPAVVALMHWGDRWEADPAGPPVEITHRDCGHPVELVLQCSHDHTTLGARDTLPRPGPGARPARVSG